MSKYLLTWKQSKSNLPYDPRPNSTTTTSAVYCTNSVSNVHIAANYNLFFNSLQYCSLQPVKKRPWHWPPKKSFLCWLEGSSCLATTICWNTTTLLGSTVHFQGWFHLHSRQFTFNHILNYIVRTYAFSSRSN